MDYGFFLGLIGLTLIIIGLCLYFLPTIIAFNRKHQNAIVILIINFLFGWTFLGWIISIAWSLSAANDNKIIQIINNNENAKTFHKYANAKDDAYSQSTKEKTTNINTCEDDIPTHLEEKTLNDIAMSEKIICFNCKNMLENKIKFCSHCGADLNHETKYDKNNNITVNNNGRDKDYCENCNAPLLYPDKPCPNCYIKEGTEKESNSKNTLKYIMIFICAATFFSGIIIIFLNFYSGSNKINKANQPLYNNFSISKDNAYGLSKDNIKDQSQRNWSKQKNVVSVPKKNIIKSGFNNQETGTIDYLNSNNMISDSNKNKIKKISYDNNHDENYSKDTVLLRNKKLEEDLNNNFDANAYISNVENKINSRWGKSEVYYQGRVLIRFKIDEQGNLNDISIVKSSGNQELEDSALHAVQSSSPVAPPPSNFNDYIYLPFIISN